MQLDRPFISLPWRFDAARLSEEVAAIPGDAWRRHPTGHRGNTAVSLVSRRGDHTDDSIGGMHAPTKWLQSDSYLAKVIASFGATVGRTRLMRIEPGGEATAHFDANLYWFERHRIHVPIITTPEVEFQCGEARQHMGAGESWLFDTLRRHNVINASPNHRVHLVIDTVGSSAIQRAIDVDIDTIVVHDAPGSRVELDCEQRAATGVIPPDRMASIATSANALLPDNDDARTVATAADRFVADWDRAWKTVGDDRDAVQYAAAIDELVGRLAAAPEVVLPYNGSSPAYVFRALLVDSAFGPKPPGTPLGGGERTTSRSDPRGSSRTEQRRDHRFDRPVFVVAAPGAGAEHVFETLRASPDAYAFDSDEARVALQSRTLHSGERADIERIDAARDEVFSAARDRRGAAPISAERMIRFIDYHPNHSVNIDVIDELFPDAAWIYVARRPDEAIAEMIDAWQGQASVADLDLEGWERDDGLAWSLPLIPAWRDLVDEPLASLCATQWAHLTARVLDDLERIAHGRWTTIDVERLRADPQRERRRLLEYTGFRRGDHAPVFTDVGALERHRKDIAEVLPAVRVTADRMREAAAIGTGFVRRRQSAQPAEAGASSVDRLASRHTQSFVQLLERADVNLVVSTYQFGRVAVLRPLDGVLAMEFTEMPTPMGVAFGPDGRLSVGTRGEVWTLHDQPSVAPKVEPVGSFSSCYVVRQRHHTGEIAIHEMAYGADGELWIVNTRFSCLATIDPDSSFAPRWTPPFISEIAPEDRCHLNGMAMREGRPAFVSIFHESDTASGWREHRATGGAVIEVETGEIVARGLSMPHSPRWYRNRLWILESGKGTLSTVDVDTGRVEEVVRLPGFTRGLAFVGRYALVGLSQVRESVFDGLPLTEADEALQSGVWIVDIEAGGIVGFVSFDGAVEEVFDIQVARGGGQVHLVGLDSDLHDQSFVVPMHGLAR